MKLLLIEDEKDLLQTIAEGLQSEGYYLDLAGCGKEAMEYIYAEDYDLIILDLNLPDMHGLDILKELRSVRKDVKVLILTANHHIESKVEGFNAGASDYLTKPFHFQELEIRIKALLRRKFLVEDSILRCGRLHFDTQKRKLFAGQEEIWLTKKESAIIEYLFFNRDKMVSAEDLLAHAWESDVDYLSNSFRVHLTSLRKKIKGVLGYNPIGNKIGEGYFLKEEEF